MAKSYILMWKSRIKCAVHVIWYKYIESCIRAPVLFNLLNSSELNDKMLDKALYLIVYSNPFNKFNNAWALMQDPLFNQQGIK